MNEYVFIAAPKVFVYNHNGNKLASMMGFNKSEAKDIDQVGKDVVMQIAAMSPVAIDKDDVDPTTVQREIEIGKEQAREEGKPEERRLYRLFGFLGRPRLQCADGCGRQRLPQLTVPGKMQKHKERGRGEEQRLRISDGRDDAEDRAGRESQKGRLLP